MKAFYISAYTQYFQRDSLFTDQNTLDHLAKNACEAYGPYKRIRVSVCSINPYKPKVIQLNFNIADISDSN